MSRDEPSLEIASWRAEYQHDVATHAEVDDAYRRYKQRRARGVELSAGRLFNQFAWGLGCAALLAVGISVVGNLDTIFRGTSSGDGVQLAQVGEVSHPASTVLPSVNASPVADDAPSAQMGAATKTRNSEPDLKSPPDGRSDPQDPGSVAGNVFIEHQGRRLAVEPGVQYEVRAGEQVTVVLGGEQQVVRGPRWVEFQLSPEQVSGYRMVTFGTKPVPRTSKLTIPTVASQERPRLWSTAVSALREGRSVEAEAALTRLSEESEPATRDAAALALAQLWHSKGDPRARAVLLRLQSSGATELTRSRAAELLRSSQ